jgi:hypothetical protein
MSLRVGREEEYMIAFHSTVRKRVLSAALLKI